MKRSVFAEGVMADWARHRAELDLTSLSYIQALVWAGRLTEDLLDDAARRNGFRSRADYEVAAVIRRAEPATLTSLEIAERLLVSPSGVTGKLDRLEAEGHIVRVRDDRDRRAVHLKLTEPGRRAVEEAFLANLQLYDRIVEKISPSDRDILRPLLEEILDVLDEINDGST